MSGFRKKGQIELVFVLVLVIIGVVAAYSFLYSGTNNNPLPQTGLSDETKVIKDSVMNLARKGLIDNLKTIYKQGGYTQNTNDSIRFGMTDVEVLYDAGNMRSFDFEKELEKNLGEYLTGNLAEETDFYGKTAEFDFESLEVDVRIIRGVITADINLPTKVNGIPVSQPYEITVPSDLFDIIRFSDEILMYQNATRFFDMNILDAMARSKPGSGYWMPLSDIITGCENAFFIDKERLVRNFRELIKYTTSHTISSKTESRKPDPFYNTNISTGSIDVAFIYPQWNLEANFEAFPSPALSIPRRLLSMSSYCLAYYNMSYSFRYPVIVYANDEPLGEWFRFAVMVNVRDNNPADEKVVISSGIADYYELCDKKAKCPVKIRVVDAAQKPLSNAAVLFDECVIDTTDSNGIAEGFAPCYAGELTIRKDGMEVFNAFVKSDDLKSVQAVLPSKRITRINLYGVPMKPGTLKSDGVYTDYTAIDRPAALDEFKDDFLVNIEILPTNEVLTESYLLFNIGPGEVRNYIEFEGLPKGEFNFVVTITDNVNGIIYGYSQFIFDSEGTEEELYLYLPIVTGTYPDYKKRGISIAPNEIIKLTGALTKAGIEPISGSEQR